MASFTIASQVAPFWTTVQDVFDGSPGGGGFELTGGGGCGTGACCCGAAFEFR
jgi:hypothetical protein